MIYLTLYDIFVIIVAYETVAYATIYFVIIFSEVLYVKVYENAE